MNKTINLLLNCSEKVVGIPPGAVLWTLAFLRPPYTTRISGPAGEDEGLKHLKEHILLL